MRNSWSWAVGSSLCVVLLSSCGKDRVEPVLDQPEDDSALLPSTDGGGGSTGSSAAGQGGAVPLPAAGDCSNGAEGGSTSCPALPVAPAPTARCGDGNVDPATEQCDGSVPASAPPGSHCSPGCTIEPPAASLCGNGAIDPDEQCDGSVLPPAAPAGSGCSSVCLLIPPAEGDCSSCAELNCASQRTDLDADLAAAEPLLECVLGPNWQQGVRAPKESCTNGELFASCYCGTASAQSCASQSPASVGGPCTALILSATDCDPGAADSFCPLMNFLNPARLNGKVMQYAQCQQDFCFDQCFNP